MVTIFSFLKPVWLDVKTETKNNPAFVALLLFLITIPGMLGVNNVSLVLLLIVLFWKKKIQAVITVELLVPSALFLLMALSWFWSIDQTATVKALPKEIFFLVLPVLFSLFFVVTVAQRKKVLLYYSYAMALYAAYYIFRAIIRYVLLHDTAVFFYHQEEGVDIGLVPKVLNAIHVTVFMALAFFVLLEKKLKEKWDYISLLLLFVFIMLLSSKNIIAVVLILTATFLIKKMRFGVNKKYIIIGFFGVALLAALSYGKVKERFLEEIKAETTNPYDENGVHFVSVNEAWNNERFHPNDYFSGTAFRVYQIRMFTELLQENSIFYTGFGLNASTKKLIEKEKQYHLHSGYGSMNFHNQYIENFAELGIFGFIGLIFMLTLNIRNALKNKDFIHFAFGILMISLFLTESFLSRQRGVVFFTVMYCLFNCPSPQNEPKTVVQ